MSASDLSASGASGAHLSASGARGAWLLARLEARRAAPPALLALVFGVTWLAAALGDAVPAAPILAGIAELDRGANVARGAARASAATLGLTLAGAALVWHAAALASRWRAGDGDWLGARPIGAGLALAASYLGLALGGLALVVATFGATALAGGPPARGLAWRAGPERHVLLQPGETHAVTLRDIDLPPGAALRVRLQNTPGSAPFGDVLVVARVDGDARAEARVRVARRTFGEVLLPARARPDGDDPRGDLVVEVTALGLGAIAVVGPRPVELWTAAGGALRVDAALAARALALLLAAAAVAVGFGAWVATPLAALGVLATWTCFAWLAEGAAFLGAFLPGNGLVQALDVAAEGRLPTGAPLGHALGVALAAASGLALARGALGSWRHAR